MIQNEILQSDVIYMGGRVMPINEFKNEFPDWYEIWSGSNKEHSSSEYFFMPDYDYGLSATMNAIYSMDFEEATAQYICSFEDKKKEGDIYHPPIRVENTLLFTPCNARRWAYYNLDTNTWSYEDIPAKFVQGEGAFVKSWMMIKDEFVYLPGKTNAFISFDYKTGTPSYHDCLKEIIQKEGKLPDFSSMSAYKDSILLFSNTNDHVYELDLKKWCLKSIRKMNVDCEGIKAAFAVPETDNVFLIKNPTSKCTDNIKNRIIKWNIKTGCVDDIANLEIYQDKNLSGDPIGGFYFDNGNLYVIPQQDSCVIKLDCQTNKTSRIKLHLDFNFTDRKNEFYKRWGYGVSFVVIAYNGYRNMSTVFFPYDYSIAEIDFEKGEIINKRKWKISGIDGLIRRSMAQELNGYYVENNFYSLKEFLDDLMKK